jgi:hypothetical protein
MDASWAPIGCIIVVVVEPAWFQIGSMFESRLVIAGRVARSSRRLFKKKQDDTNGIILWDNNVSSLEPVRGDLDPKALHRRILCYVVTMLLLIDIQKRRTIFTPRPRETAPSWSVNIFPSFAIVTSLHWLCSRA